MKNLEVLSVHVKIDQCFEVKSEAGSVNMINFHGTAESDFFNGVILPGGVDTQSQFAGCDWSLSARYILEGTDKNGQTCRIFIENNGHFIDGEIVTEPRILTDNPELAWLEKAELVGRVVGEEGGICIEFTYKV